MPTIDATNVAAVISAGASYAGASFAGLRDATTGTSVDASSDGQDKGISLVYARGGQFMTMYRVFARFGTSGISIAPSDATLKIYGRANLSYHSNSDFFVVAGTQGTGNPSTADWDAIAGWDTSTGANGSGAGDQEGNVTKYTAEWVNGTTAWDESDYNELTLNAAALTAMANVDNFYICIIDSVRDLRDNSAGGQYVDGMYFDDDAGKEMQIDYTAGVAAAADNAIFFGTNF